MEAKFDPQTDPTLIEATQRLSPEERLNAFLTHCRLVMELYEAGLKLDPGKSRPQP